MSRAPDQDIHEGAKAPSPPAAGFEAQMLAMLPALRRYARSLSRSDGDGEDLLQDSVERALSRRGQWRGVNLRAWMFSIMTNLNRTRLRAPRTETTDLDDAGDVPAVGAEIDPVERIRLSRALDQLAPDHRAVLMLVAVEGYRYQEVAEMLDIPLGTVMSRLSRARQSLGEALGEDKIIPLRRLK